MVLCVADNVDETTADDTGDVVDGIAVELLLCWGIVGLVLLIVVDLVTLFVRPLALLDVMVLLQPILLLL